LNDGELAISLVVKELAGEAVDPMTHIEIESSVIIEINPRRAEWISGVLRDGVVGDSLKHSGAQVSVEQRFQASGIRHHEVGPAVTIVVAPGELLSVVDIVFINRAVCHRGK
jgi:hypothetical protein